MASLVTGPGVSTKNIEWFTKSRMMLCLSPSSGTTTELLHHRYRLTRHGNRLHTGQAHTQVFLPGHLRRHSPGKAHLPQGGIAYHQDGKQTRVFVGNGMDPSPLCQDE